MTTSNPGALPEPEAAELLRKYDIPYPDHALAYSAEEAARLAQALGYPVVLKAVSRQVIHKSDVGGVIVGLDTAADVRTAYDRILHQVAASSAAIPVEGVLVCRQMPAGLEVIVGSARDAIFGPVVMFGLGGIFAEIFNDVSIRVAPLRPRDAWEMICDIRGYPLLSGARGRPSCDVEALADLLLAISELVGQHPEIAELDLNPVRLYEHGLTALDVRLLVDRKEEA